MHLSRRPWVPLVLLALACPPALAARDVWRLAPTETSDPALAAVWNQLSINDPSRLEGHRLAMAHTPAGELDLTLEEGTAWLEPEVEGTVRGVFFEGAATLNFVPASRAEATLLEHYLGVRDMKAVRLPWVYIWSTPASALVREARSGEAVAGPPAAADDYRRARNAFVFHGMENVYAVLNERGPARGSMRVIFPYEKEILEYTFAPGETEPIRISRFANVAGGDTFFWQTICSSRKPAPGIDVNRPVVREVDIRRHLLADAREYRIAVDVEKGSGNALVTAEIDLTVKKNGLEVLPMALAQFLEVRSVRAGDQPLPHLQWSHDEAETTSQGLVLVALPDGARFDTELTLTFDYYGPLFETEVASWSPLRSEDLWYPQPPEDPDGALFHTSLTVDPKDDALAVGSLVAEEEAEGRKTLSFRSVVPERGATIQFGRFRTAEEKVGEMTVEAYVPGALATGSADQDAAVRGVVNLTTAREVSNALKTMVALFGPMDGEHLRVSTTTAGYGRGFHQLLLVPTQRYLGTANWEGQQFLAHEVAHQWFGNKVQVASYWRDAWIEEGFAEYASLEYIRQRYGPERAAEALRRYRNQLLEKDSHGVREQIGPISLGPRLVVLAGRPDSAYQPVVYYKGAYVLEMLRGFASVVKKDDEALFLIMRDFIERSKGRRVCTEDFRKVVEEHLGIPMDWYFDQWVYGTGIPKLDVSYRREGDGYRFTVDQDPATAFQMLVPVSFQLGGKKTSMGFLKVKPGRSETFIPVRGKARGVIVNTHDEVLAVVEVSG